MFLHTQFLQIFTGSLHSLLPRLYWDMGIYGVHSGLGVSSLFDLHCMLCGVVLIAENLFVFI